MDYRSLFRENKNRKNSGRDLGLLPVHGCNMLMLPLRTPSIGLANHVSFVFPQNGGNSVFRKRKWARFTYDLWQTMNCRSCALRKVSLMYWTPARKSLPVVTMAPASIVTTERERETTTVKLAFTFRIFHILYPTSILS